MEGPAGGSSRGRRGKIRDVERVCLIPDAAPLRDNGSIMDQKTENFPLPLFRRGWTTLMRSKFDP